MTPCSAQSLPVQTTISGLFNSDFQFAIPSYQRAYAWGKKQHGQFVEDLREQPPNKPYFLGHLLFERDAVGGTSRQMLVIDGQQRLTTVIIFINCLMQDLLRRAASSGNEGDIALIAETLRTRYLQRPDGNRLKTVPYDNAFFNQLIVENQKSGTTAETCSQRRIAEARVYFLEQFQAESSVETLASWLDIVETAIVTTFEVPGKVQATQIFAFQNDRGIDLTNLEKLKAFLMHKVYRDSANQAEREAVSEIEHYFADIYKLTERLEWLTEDQVLNHHSTAFLKRWDDSALNNIKSVLKKESQSASVSWIKEFCHHLRETYQHAVEIQKELEHDCSIADVLILDPESSWPVLLKLYHFHKAEIQQPQLQRVLRLMEVTLFKKEYSTGGYRTNRFPWLAKMYECDIPWITSTLVHFSQQGFREYWPFNERYLTFLQGNDHYVKATRYLLWKYENYLRSQHRNQVMLPAEYLNKYHDTAWNSTIDHVMPKNPAGAGHPQEFVSCFLNNLGNLVLMNHGKNSSANNSLPLDKRYTLLNSTLISHRRVAETISQSGKWGAEEILARKQEIVDFALERWSTT